MIEGINANDNLPAVPDDGWEQVYVSVELHADVVGVPYQGDPVVGLPVVIDTSWWPTLDYSAIDSAYKLSPSVTTTEQWGNTIYVVQVGKTWDALRVLRAIGNARRQRNDCIP